jgi:hypothetical protein
MELINKQNNLTLRILNLFEHSLEPIFKLTPILGAGKHRSQI